LYLRPSTSIPTAPPATFPPACLPRVVFFAPEATPSRRLRCCLSQTPSPTVATSGSSLPEEEGDSGSHYSVPPLLIDRLYQKEGKLRIERQKTHQGLHVWLVWGVGFWGLFLLGCEPSSPKRPSSIPQPKHRRPAPPTHRRIPRYTRGSPTFLHIPPVWGIHARA